MTKNTFRSIIILILIGLVGGFFAYKKYFTPQPPPLFKTEHPEKRTIKKQIFTSGFLEIKDSLKIGTQVTAGIVKEVYVKENQFVKKGTILADIDTGKEDKDVLLAKAHLAKSEKELAYQKNNYLRKKALFSSGQLAKNEFDKIETDYQKAMADRNADIVSLEKAKLEIAYTHVVAPDDGIITVNNATKGMPAINDYQNILFEIAHDITEMKAVLDIDESDIGSIKPGQKVKLTINALPENPIKTSIHEISFAPKKKNADDKETNLFYKAYVEINNKKRLLHPGMMVNAKITVNKIKDALSISGFAFQINPETLKIIADKKQFAYTPLTSEQKRKFKAEHEQEKVRYVWVMNNNSFIQQAITTGLSDDNYWLVISGLTEKDNVIIDVQEPNEMEKLYKEWFRSAF